MAGERTSKQSMPIITITIIMIAIALSSCQKIQSLSDSSLVVQFHVDSWNLQGWQDPFSSRAFTRRQECYLASAAVMSVYIPQVVRKGVIQSRERERERERKDC